MSKGLTRALLLIGAILSALPCTAAPVALLLGACLGLSSSENGEGARIRALTPKLLAGSVIALGASIDLRAIARVGLEGAGLTLFTIALCLGAGLLLTRVLGVPRRIGLLIAAGTAICGGSAIAALAPVVRAEDDETSVALGTVFVLNAVALVALPFVGRAMGLDAERFGLLAALAVHDTSSVVGAAMSFGDHAVEIATTVKLARATWIVPVALVAGALVPSGAVGDAQEERAYPWFIVAFVACAAVFTFVPGLETIGAIVAGLAKRAMVVTLFLVGAGLSRGAIRRTGVAPFALGVILWVGVSLTSIALVTH